MDQNELVHEMNTWLPMTCFSGENLSETKLLPNAIQKEGSNLLRKRLSPPPLDLDPALSNHGEDPEIGSCHNKPLAEVSEMKSLRFVRVNAFQNTSGCNLDHISAGVHFRRPGCTDLKLMGVGRAACLGNGKARGCISSCGKRGGLHLNPAASKD
jgi:hypothetical protein